MNVRKVRSFSKAARRERSTLCKQKEVPDAKYWDTSLRPTLGWIEEAKQQTMADIASTFVLLPEHSNV